MTTATVTAIEPTTVEPATDAQLNETLDKWQIQERTQKRAEYEYQAALCAKAMGDDTADYHAYLVGRILGIPVGVIKEDLANVEA